MRFSMGQQIRKLKYAYTSGQLQVFNDHLSMLLAIILGQYSFWNNVVNFDLERGFTFNTLKHFKINS